MREGDFDLKLSDFEPLGDFAPAGFESTRLALERAQRSSRQNRVPIAGAAVYMAPDETLETVAVGNNGRIPAPDDDGTQYDRGDEQTPPLWRWLFPWLVG